MWCLAPEWPAHARHLAVEFVHPVIVGKRALPAAAVGPRHAVEQLRLLTRPGDVLVAVGRRDTAAVPSLMRRAPAWGLATMWLGPGERPPPGAADHVLFIDGADDAQAEFSGRLVRLYHLLWELTHVCFEHSGLLAAERPVERPACPTCSDEATVAEVVAVERDGATTVRTAGGIEAVEASLVEDASPGDLVLVHAGCLVSILERAVA